MTPTPTTPPAAAISAERLESLRRRCTDTPGNPANYAIPIVDVRDLLTALDARDQEIARLTESYSVQCENALALHNRLLAAEARLAQANEALNKLMGDAATREDAGALFESPLGRQHVPTSPALCLDAPYSTDAAHDFRDGVCIKCGAMIYSIATDGQAVPTQRAQSAGGEVEEVACELERSAELTVKERDEREVWERERDKTKWTAADTLNGRAAALIRKQASALEEARASALEEAAKVTQSFIEHMEKDSTKVVLRVVADAIRALQQQKEQG